VHTIKPRILYKAGGDATIESSEIEQLIFVDFPKVFVTLVFSRERFVLKANQISRAASDRAPEGSLVCRVEGVDMALQVRRA
jgi:hypothetical protein